MPSERPRLYLITQPVADASRAAPLLEAALGAGDVACVLLRLAARDEAAAKRIVRAVAAITSAHDAALLVEHDVSIAARAGADGAHVRGREALSEALDRLKPERIVGCGGLRLRDDAMMAGEAGADYVMFGESGPDGEAPAFADVLERTEWWADIFNVPCVACAPRLDTIADLAGAGADFIALGDCVWSDRRGAAAAVRDAQTALAAAAG